MQPEPHASLAISIADPDDPNAAACLAAYYQELAALFTESFDPAQYPTLASDMRPPAGQLYVARQTGEAIACAALIFVGNGTCEIRRMWVKASARGQGVARHLLRHIEDDARRLGMMVIRLDTNRALAEAQRMYRNAGYNEIARFNDNPYAHHWFEKKL